MLKLCGFHISNYFNKARLALLEKGIEFEMDAECRPFAGRGVRRPLADGQGCRFSSWTEKP
jgi:hypothetical protein